MWRRGVHLGIPYALYFYTMSMFGNGRVKGFAAGTPHAATGDEA
jgi:hypothetical protein